MNFLNTFYNIIIDFFMNLNIYLYTTYLFYLIFIYIMVTNSYHYIIYYKNCSIFIQNNKLVLLFFSFYRYKILNKNLY